MLPRPRVRWLVLRTAARVVVPTVLVAACSEGATLDATARDDAGTEQRQVVCANVGCAAPPACGEACTAPCGCCANLACAADAEAPDAADGAAPDADGGARCGGDLLTWRGDAGGACEAWLDAHCCAEGRACADEATCNATVACVERCRGDAGDPDDGCLARCPADPSGALEALASCTKRVPDGGAGIPEGCRWP